MAEVDRESRRQVPDRCPFLTPQGQAFHGKVVAKRVEGRQAPTVRRPDSQLTGGANKPGSKGSVTQRLVSLGNKKGLRGTLLSPLRSPFGVAPKLLCCARMQRHEPRLVEFALPNLKSGRIGIQLNVVRLQTDRFSHAHARTG